MGKAGILEGGKGDIMIPSAHIFEGTADNYPFQNELSAEDFNDEEIRSCIRLNDYSFRNIITK